MPVKTIFLSVCLLASGALPGCRRETDLIPAEDTPTRDDDAMSTVAEVPNQQLLDEVNHATAWFRAKKTRPVWAKLVTEDQTVQTLEGIEQVKAGHFLCRGEIGEIWPQSAESLAKKYTESDQVVDGWKKYIPKPDAQGVMAAQVDRNFTVQASWGMLHGKPGDFVVKNFADKDEAYPVDVWIVDQDLFAATYERSGQ